MPKQLDSKLKGYVYPEDNMYSHKIEKPKPALKKVTLRNRVGKAIRNVINYPFGGKINNPDYSSWAENIRKGTPQDNLKKYGN